MSVVQPGLEYGRPKSWVETLLHRGAKMHFTVLMHNDEDGGFWAEVEEIPGCITQGDTAEELEANLKEVIELCSDGLVEDYVDSVQNRVAIERGDATWVMSLKLERNKAAAKA